jgi:hypothetical protein
VTAIELPVEHDRGTEAGSYEHEREVGNALRDSVSLLGDRSEIDVVLQLHRHAKRPLELLAEVGPEPRQVGGGHLPVCGRDDGRQGDDRVLQ